MSARNRIIVVLSAAAALAATFLLGTALAADARLDLADDHIEKAIALVNNSQNPNAKDPDRPFGGHDTKAMRLLEAAREQIAAAKAYADDPKNWNTTSTGQAAVESAPGPPNIALVGAVDSVGGALFGDAVFGASGVALDDGSGNVLPAVQLDLHDATPLPAIFTVFTNPGPPNEPLCRAYLQVEVGPGGVVLRLDPAAAPPDFHVVGDFQPLVGLPPNPCAEPGGR
jgi:hypothetical protein